jgi:hypothetical protein
VAAQGVAAASGFGVLLHRCEAFLPAPKYFQGGVHHLCYLFTLF